MTPRALLAPARLAGRPVLRSQSDGRLVDLVRAGSEPAFEAIVARYRSPLLRYCRRLLPESRAEDVVQQTFLKAFHAMQRDDAGLDLRPWLYRIAHNTALNSLRDRGLRHEELSESIDGVERPDQASERRQRLREVLVAVQDLPTRQRDAIVLRELEGRSYDEIAGELGVTGGAVRQLLNRARTTLRAAATAVVPMPLLLRFPWNEAAEPTAGRVAELVAAGGAGAVATKVAATALVTGAVAGAGAAVVTDEGQDAGASSPAAPAATRPDNGPGSPGAAVSSQALDEDDDRRGRGRGGDDDDDDGRRGRGRGRGGDDDEDNSGPGSSRSGPGEGDDGDDDRSGHGDGDGDDDDEDHRGSRGGDDSGSSRSGSGRSGSGSGDSGGNDGDSSGSSGSGSSGSGSSGSGSSGSGSGSGDDPDDD